MQTDKLKHLDGFGLSDYLRTLPPTEHRNACDEIADFVSLENWCQMEEPFQTYVFWAIEGESGSYGNGRMFEIEVLGEGVSLMQGFDKRGRRKIRKFEVGEVARLKAGEAKVLFRTYGSISSMASDRGKIREAVTIDHDEAIEPPKDNTPKQGGKRKR